MELVVMFWCLTVLFLAATVLLTTIAPRTVNQTVWGRAIAEMIIASVFFLYAHLWRQGKFWGYWKLLTTSGWGALVVISVIVLPGKYPVWVRFEQIAQGVLLIALVWTLAQPDIRKNFTKKNQQK